MPAKATVICFGTPEYAGSLCALRHSALTAGGADAVTVYGPDDVTAFFEANPELLRGTPRGYGWWAWKPHLIHRALTEAADGEWVVYVDAGAVLSSDLRTYLDAVPDGKDIVLFSLGNGGEDRSIAAWTSARAIFKMGAHTLGGETQVNAAVQVYRAGPRAREFADAYLRWCCDPEVVTDPVAGDRNAPQFRDHRHDQSVLSILAAAWRGDDALAVWRDPTQYGCDHAVPPGTPALDPLLFHHRAQLPLPPKVAVITAATGSRHLRECLTSVQAQTYPNIEHWVFADGPEFAADVARAVEEFKGRQPIVHVPLPRNTGAHGWNGHRVYAAASWLVDAPLVAFLDEDNSYCEDHIGGLVEALANTDGGACAWAFSLRQIVAQDGTFVCNDTCESLGGLTHTCLGAGDHLVDTSCYLIPREMAADVCAGWNCTARGGGQHTPPRLEVDRGVCQALLRTAPWACSRKHSVRYRTGSSALSVKPEFFLDNDTGHDFQAKKDVYLFHFNAEQTERYLALHLEPERPCHALDEWQMTLWQGLHATHNVFNGFTNTATIPRGATVLCCMCHPQELPLDWLAERDDLLRVCYTMESPNIRHQAQWDAAFLTRHFDHVLTYWKPLLRDFRIKSTWCPHNTHHLDLDDPAHRAQLRQNRGVGRGACIVLERRDLHGEYAINGVRLRCLDALRERYVDGLRNVTVYGQGWGGAACVLQGRAVLGHAAHRSQDPRHSVDIMQDYVFAVIVENCDAEGYASEKLYDALLAGCIPMYYGDAPAFVPRNLYLDLREFADGAAVQQHLDAMSCEDVTTWRQRVITHREGVLRNVSVRAFADTVRSVIAA